MVLLENLGRILAHLEALFEQWEHLLEQWAVLLENRQFIRRKKFILEHFAIY